VRVCGNACNHGEGLTYGSREGFESNAHPTTEFDVSYEPGKFRDDCAECEWIFDLFGCGFDFLNGGFRLSPDETIEKQRSSAEDEINRRDTVSDLVASDKAIPDRLGQFLHVSGGDAEIESPDYYIRLFSVLSAIDGAAADLNYLYDHTRLGGKGWMRVTEHFERNGEQLQNKVSGYVVFKARYCERAPYQRRKEEGLKGTKWKPIPDRGEYLENYFENLLRVHAPHECAVEFRIINPTQDFHKAAWTALKVGIVPLVQELKLRTSDAQLLPRPLFFDAS
jgi:hypothetical protein